MGVPSCPVRDRPATRILGSAAHINTQNRACFSISSFVDHSTTPQIRTVFPRPIELADP
jgi:hypothetical protein